MLTAYIKAEELKNRHTVAAKLFWIVPGVSILLGIIFSGLDARYYQMNQFNWWYTLLFPMLLLLVTAFTVQRERKLKNRAMQVLPVDMKKLWAAKVFCCFKTLFLAVVLIFCAQEGISRIFAGGAARGISTTAALTAAALWLILSVWQIPLWLFVNQKFGFTFSILFGLICNIVVGVLGSTYIWWVINPFSYISRLMCPVLKILPNGLPAEPGNVTFYPQLLDQGVIPIGVGISVILFIVCFAVTALWYERRGKKGWEK